MFDKEALAAEMAAFGDKNKDLAAALGMSVPNFSTIWNGRQQFNVRHIRAIAKRYSLSPEQVWDIFLFPTGRPEAPSKKQAFDLDLYLLASDQIRALCDLQDFYSKIDGGAAVVTLAHRLIHAINALTSK